MQYTKNTKSTPVPGAIAGIAAGGLGAGVVAGLEVFRTYSFESEFWKWLNQTVQEMGEGKTQVSKQGILILQREIWSRILETSYQIFVVSYI
jgi:hypothetical protein